jgi:hypothetical protein
LRRVKKVGLTLWLGQLKIFEAYYLKGKEPKWSDAEDAMEEDPIPLVYRLWLHPDQSDESWCAIVERVLSYRGRGLAGISIKESRRILDQYANSHYFNGVDAPAGFLAGAEKRIFQFLVGETELGRRYTYNPTPAYPEKEGALYSVRWFGFMDYVDMCVWLSMEGAFNPNSSRNPFYLGCYFLKQWRRFLEADTGSYTDTCSGDKRFEENIKKYFVTVFHYPDPVEGGNDLERQLYCQEARDVLNNANRPPLLKGWWEEVKFAGY